MTYQDFNGSPGDLGGDGQSLEEGGLLGAETGVLGRDAHVNWGPSSSLGGGGHFVLVDLVPDLGQVGLGEDKAHISLQVGEHPEGKIGWKSVGLDFNSPQIMN